MLTARSIALAITLFAAFVGDSQGQSLSPAQQPSEHRSEDQKTAKTFEKDDPAFIRSVVIPIGNFIHDNRDEITAFSTAIIALFTIILGVFTVSLARSTRRVANAAVSVEIPRLFISGIEFQQHGVGNLDAQLQFPRVAVRVDNYGRTPAFLDRQSIEMSITLKLPSKPEYPGARDLDPGTVIERGVSYDGLSVARLPELLTLEAIRSLKEETTYIWVYGFIAYRDFLNTRHEMRFCARYRIGTDAPGFPARFIFDGPEQYAKSY